MSAIVCRGLGKDFLSYKKSEGLLASLKGFVQREHIVKAALLDLDLEIEKGIIVGIVGSNGAGKTTLLKILSGLVHPTRGAVEVLGFRPSDRKTAFLKQMSILLGQKNQLWWDISPKDSFYLLGAIYDIDNHVLKARIHTLSEMLHCTGQLDIQLRRLSLGERMKMELIGALLHRPQILFLDEPTIGLDILAQSTIRQFLETYVAEEKPTILLTSHYMDDIAELSDRLLLMGQGQIKYSGTVSEFMKGRSHIQKVICRLEAPLKESIQVLDRWLLERGSECVTAEMAPTEVSEYLNALMKLGNIVEIRFEETNFEDVIHGFLEKDRSVS